MKTRITVEKSKLLKLLADERARRTKKCEKDIATWYGDKVKELEKALRKEEAAVATLRSKTKAAVIVLKRGQVPTTNDDDGKRYRSDRQYVGETYLGTPPDLESALCEINKRISMFSADARDKVSVSEDEWAILFNAQCVR